MRVSVSIIGNAVPALPWQRWPRLIRSLPIHQCSVPASLPSCCRDVFTVAEGGAGGLPELCGALGLGAAKAKSAVYAMRGFCAWCTPPILQGEVF